MGILERVAWAWLVLLLLQLAGASHVVHQNLETEAAAVKAVPPSIVDSQLRTGCHFQAPKSWINGMPQSNKLLLWHHLLLLASAAEPHHRISGYQFRCPACVPEPAITMNCQPLGTTVHPAQGGTVDVDVAVDSGLIANTCRARHLFLASEPAQHSLFDRTVQSSTGSLWIALSTVIVKAALDQWKKKRGGGDVAAFAKLLIFFLAFAAFTNYAMAATGHSQCTHDPNTQHSPCARLSKLVQARNESLEA